MISVIIPLYNKEKYIVDTIKNVLNQTFQSFEIIVVDDGSTDEGVYKVKQIEDFRVKVISKDNGGVSSARNKGVEEAKFDYIAFLDADDEWENNHLENILSLIDKYNDVADVFVTNFFAKYSDSKKKVNRIDLTTGIIENYFQKILNKPVIHTSSVAIRKTAFYEVGQFNAVLSRGEDIDLWIRLAKKYNIAYSDVATSNYLQDANNNSSSKVFHPSKSIVYYLDFISSISYYERQFYKKIIIRKFFSYLIKDKNPKYAWLLLKKYKFNLI